MRVTVYDAMNVRHAKDQRSVIIRLVKLFGWWALIGAWNKRTQTSQIDLPNEYSFKSKNKRIKWKKKTFIEVKK